MSDAVEGELEGFLRSHGPFENPPLLANGESVGEWTIRAFLGRGGSAEVYRATNATTGLVAALKVLCKSDDRTRERFRREAQLVAGMRCAAFPKFYGAGCADGRFYIAEELLEPMPLPRGDAAVARFVIAVAAGVEELHRRGFIHRDIKPRNVMMRPSTGESVLIDMGLAKEESVTHQACGDTMSVVDGRAVGVGTPGFSAPEQFAGGKIGPATDVHALGMLVNVCFDGRPPRAWVDIVRRSTSSIPEQRYSTVAELVKAIENRHVAHNWIFGFVVVGIAASLAIGMFFALKKPTQSGDRPQVEVQKGGIIGEKRIVIVKSNDETVVELPKSTERSEKPKDLSENIPRSGDRPSSQGGDCPQAEVSRPLKDGEVQDGEESQKTIQKSRKGTQEILVNAILEATHQGEGVGGLPIEETITNEVADVDNLLSLGETRYESGAAVTRIALSGKDISIPGAVRLSGKRRIEILGPGRITASIVGPRSVSLVLERQATLINLTAMPYPESSMKYVLKGACYLNFKNLDGPADGDAKNIWVDDFEGNGTPSFRFRGPDSYEEVRKADKRAAEELMRKGILPSY